MLRDSLTGLPNRLGFSETIEAVGGKADRDVEYAVLVVDMLRFSRINESMGCAGRRRIADHLRPPADLGAAGGRRAGADRRQ